MSDEQQEQEGRGWILVLAGMVLLTVAAVVAFELAPFDPPPNERADTGTPGVVRAEYRIVALQDDGSLVILDDRTGEVSEVVRREDAGSVSVLDTTASHKSAYLTFDNGAIDLVHLKSGEEVHHDTGRATTIGPIAFPQLPRTVPRPAAEQMAFVTDGDGGDQVTVENLTTGGEHVIEAAGGALASIDDLVLSPFENRLFGIADDGHTLFRLDTDRSDSLDQAATAGAPADVERYVDATPHADTIAAIVQRADGSTDLVEIDRETLEPTEVLYDAPPDGERFRSVDADEKATTFLLVTEDGRLLRFAPSKDSEPQALADGVDRAVW